MKAVRLQRPGHFEPVDIDPPPPPPAGHATVATRRMGICGTDHSCFRGKFPFFDYPRIPGHELGVEVVAAGEGVTNVAVGDACAVEPYLNCGECFACRSGAPNCCQRLRVVGVMTDGGLCERFNIRADKLHPSKDLSFDQLALVETLAIGCHASDRGDPRGGDHALVIGAGPIGLATLEFVRLTGANVAVMDLSVSRLEFVRKTYGVERLIHAADKTSEAIDAAVADLTGGDRFRVVIDATGHPASMSGAPRYCAHTGRLVYVGITTSDLAFPHPVIHRPELTILASRNAMPADFPRIIGLIADGRIDTTPWITHRLTIDEVPERFEPLMDPAAGVLKAVIEVA